MHYSKPSDSQFPVTVTLKWKCLSYVYLLQLVVLRYGTLILLRCPVLNDLKVETIGISQFNVMVTIASLKFSTNIFRSVFSYIGVWTV